MKKILLALIIVSLPILMMAQGGQKKDSAKTEKKIELKEVVVKGTRPMLKARGGKLSYDLSKLTERKAVSNVYEALKQLPGVNEEKGSLKLAGANSLTVILNGKPTTMTANQLKTLLETMPVSRVEKAEVMYSAPPQYHVRGAVINLVLKRAKEYSFQGETRLWYSNEYFSSYGAGGNMRMTTPKLAVDLMYEANRNEDLQHLAIDSRHTLDGALYSINQESYIPSKKWKHFVRGGLELNLSEKSSFDIAYTGNFIPKGKQNSFTTGSFQNSESDMNSNNQMNNVAAHYISNYGLTVGADYTNYHSSGNQNLTSNTQNGISSFYLNSLQNIDRLSLTVDQEHTLKRGWNMGYGLSYSYTNDYDSQSYQKAEGFSNLTNTDSHLEEQTTDFYFRLGKHYKSGVSFSLSATGEYYTVDSYHKWAIFPQASLTYFKTPTHIFQFGLSSEKNYPGYWEMQPYKTYIDAYAVAEGSPSLRPASNYSMNISYIFKQKYVATLFFNTTSDYFQQAVYQSAEELQLIYQTRNWNYSQQVGLNIIFPFKVHKWLDSRLSLLGLNIHQKCNDYFDIPFDRNKWLGIVRLNNTFIVNKNLSFELNGKVQSKAIQGTYDISGIPSLDATAKWTFCEGKAILSARLDDVFNSEMPKVKVRFKGQNLDMNTGGYTRNFSLNFTYRFGGYKATKKKDVDTSRFGH
jgi:hypothetical protein